jgi:hypothetical protein
LRYWCGLLHVQEAARAAAGTSKPLAPSGGRCRRTHVQYSRVSFKIIDIEEARDILCERYAHK